MKRLSFFLIILLIILSLYPQKATAEGVFQVGEELTYSVSFLGIKLGEIKVFSIAEEEYQGETIYKSKATMNSNPAIPFAYLSANFVSWMSPELTHSLKFEGSNKFGSKSPWVFQRLIMEYEKDNLIFERWIDNEFNKKVDVDISTKINDGSSLFFFARQFAHSGRRVKIPTVIDKDVEYTYINFSKKRVPVKISAVDYPVQTVYFDGTAEWEGIYGLSGEFEGWFSDDIASIPIKAKMKVYMGNVIIELTDWKRKNWSPPHVK